MTTHARRLLSRAGMIAIALAVVATAQGQDASGLDPAVDQILTRLEARKVSDLRSKVRWSLYYPIDESEQLKHGQVWYKDLPPVPKFKVRFERRIVENRSTSLEEAHLFDGRWYTHIDDNTRTLTRTEMRREGDEYNPYRLGEGSFPLPFGQRKDDILREFEPTLAPPPRAGDPAPPGTDVLRLTPRPTSPMRDEYRYVDLWVIREGPMNGLPVRVRAAQLKGTGEVNDILTIDFEDIQLNTGFSESVFSVSRPRGYAEEVQRLDASPN